MPNLVRLILYTLMKVSCFTIARNALKFNYPILESITSILPICDEFVVNVGDSEDGTLDMVKSIQDPKIKIIENRWDMSMGETVLAHQTNLALKECTGDWAFYLQSDEVIHQDDLPILRQLMAKYLKNKNVEALRFQWLHFYGSYYRYRIDAGWFQKNDRIIRNNGEIESYGDAGGFRRKDGRSLQRKKIWRLLYHYGWVQPELMITQRRVNAEQIGFTRLQPQERTQVYSFGDLDRFPVYFGTHPMVMRERVGSHVLSADDWKHISRKYWWHPARILRIRYKTSRRIKHKMGK